MRKRGQQLHSPEANFIFGGPDNESVYETPNGKLVAYDAATAAVDSIIDASEPVPPGSIISQRDEMVKEIKAKIPATKKIEEDRRRIADALNQQQDS